MDRLSCNVVGRWRGGGGCIDQLFCKVVGRWWCMDQLSCELVGRGGGVHGSVIL